MGRNKRRHPITFVDVDIEIPGLVIPGPLDYGELILPDEHPPINPDDFLSLDKNVDARAELMSQFGITEDSEIMNEARRMGKEARAGGSFEIEVR